MTKIVKIVLSPIELDWVRKIAEERQSCHFDDGQKRNPRITGFDANYLGVFGEACAYKANGEDGELNTNPLPYGDRHVGDLLLSDGRRVEVKATTYTWPKVYCILEDDEIDHIEHICLVQVRLPNIGLVHPVWEWSEVEPFLVKKDFGHGERWAFQPIRIK